MFNRLRIAAMCAAAFLTLTAASPGAVVSSRFLTQDYTDDYRLSNVDEDGFLVTAPPTNIGSNTRKLYWWKVNQAKRNGQVCATFTMTHDQVQPGTAHRITATSAITVTRNVWAEAYWTFNVHTWQGDAFTQVAQFDMSSVVFASPGVYRPLPWRMCTRVTGTTLFFKLWVPPDPEPAWNDANVRTATVPDGKGRHGLYAGHLAAGRTLAYVDVRLR